MATDRKDVNNIVSVSEFMEKKGIKSIQKEPLPGLLKRKGKKFPLETLDEDLQKIVQEIHRIVKAPIGICAQSVLAAISYCTQSYANVHIDSMHIPLSLYFFTVAESGERKSAVDSIATKPIALEEQKLHVEYEGKMERYLREKMSAKKDQVLHLMEPLNPTLLMNEPTLEGIVKCFEKGRPSLALFSTEGGNFLSGYAMSPENRLRTAAALSSLWDGEPISRVRATQTLKLTDKRLAFHLMIQPAIACNLFGDTGLVDQGFMSRCLLSYPESTMGKRDYIAEDIYQTDAYKRYAARLDTLLTNSPHHFRTLTLTDDAKAIFIDFYTLIESELAKPGASRDVAGFTNKMVNQAARLAGVMALYADPSAKVIGKDHLYNACLLMRFYQSEMVRLVAESPVQLKSLGENQMLSLAQQLLEWLQQPEIMTKHFPDGLIKKRLLQQYAPYKFRKPDLLSKVIDVLLMYEYLEYAAGSTNTWTLNFEQIT